jgi:carbonic anhydrase
MKIVEIVYRCDGSDTAIRSRPADAQAARDRLDGGSRTMAALLAGAAEGSGVARRVVPIDPRDLGLALGEHAAPAQRPYAAVLGCSDARVPIELIFNEGPNDLFVIRVAGNGLGSEVLGSLRYAVDHLGESLKLIVVLGHSGCGAVSAAVDVFLKPEAYLALAAQHNLRGILDRLLVVVHAAARRLAAVYGPDVAHRHGYRDALIESAIVANAALAARTVQQEIGGSQQGLRAAYGVYLLAQQRVWAPRAGSADCEGLAHPPADAAAFAEFADAVVHSMRIATFVGRGADAQGTVAAIALRGPGGDA